VAQKDRSQLIVALDFDRLPAAEAMARRLAGAVGMFKVGSQLYTAHGPEAVTRLAGLGPGIFLDLKFHDIPNTVAGAVEAAAGLPGIRLMNIHALGGQKMMNAAVRALAGRKNAPALLAVTVLTSLDALEFERVGLRSTPPVRALKLAKLARVAGLDGVVASAHETRQIRSACGPRFLIVVPGVRPAAAAKGDQARVGTPAEAIAAGADYIVVGRPITQAHDPRAAAEAIVAEIAAARRRKRV
jgi:orotidine-5'-phosphate decarboxylase